MVFLNFILCIFMQICSSDIYNNILLKKEYAEQFILDCLHKSTLLVYFLLVPVYLVVYKSSTSSPVLQQITVQISESVVTNENRSCLSQEIGVWIHESLSHEKSSFIHDYCIYSHSFCMLYTNHIIIISITKILSLIRSDCSMLVYF